MRTTLALVSMICGLAAVIFSGLTIAEHNKWRETVAAREHTQDASPKFTWKQQVAIIGGFYRGLWGEVLEVADEAGDRRYYVKVSDEDGNYRMITARESELGVMPRKSASSSESNPPSDVEELKPLSGALYYKNHEGRLYRGDVDTVKPMVPDRSRIRIYAPDPPTVR